MDSWVDPSTLVGVYYGPGTTGNRGKSGKQQISTAAHRDDDIYENQIVNNTNNSSWIDQEYDVKINKLPPNYHPENYVLTSG